MTVFEVIRAAAAMFCAASIMEVEVPEGKIPEIRAREWSALAAMASEDIQSRLREIDPQVTEEVYQKADECPNRPGEGHPAVIQNLGGTESYLSYQLCCWSPGD